MTALTKIVSLLVWAAFSTMAVAAPVQDGTVKEIVHDRAVATTTHDAMAAACTIGMSASKQHAAAAYPITNYTVITPNEDWASYMVDQDWYRNHFVSGPHYMAFTHKSDPYGAFKCQYNCNAADNCNSYFIWYENVGTEDEHLNCVLFDAVIPTSAFIETNGTIAAGAYDKLCN